MLSPRDWPGATCVNTLISGHRDVQGDWYDRTGLYRARYRGQDVSLHDFTERLDLPLVSLPCWGHLSLEEYAKECLELVETIEKETLERHENEEHDRSRRARHPQHRSARTSKKAQEESCPAGPRQRSRRASGHGRPLSRLQVPILGGIERVQKREARGPLPARKFQASRPLRRSSASLPTSVRPAFMQRFCPHRLLPKRRWAALCLSPRFSPMRGPKGPAGPHPEPRIGPSDHGRLNPGAERLAPFHMADTSSLSAVRW